MAGEDLFNLAIQNTAPTVTTSTYDQSDIIDEHRFSQSFPYQFLLLIAQDNGAYKRTKWVFTLPIPPQDLTINMPIATSVQATLNGIVEQHGGAPFRDITLSGTTGITPIKNNANPQDNGNLLTNILTTIFAGTASAATGVGTSLRNVFQPSANFSPNVNNSIGLSGDNDNIPANSTGYYQFRLLQKFIESYVELKKKNTHVELDGESFDAKDLRLAFCIWKDESIYLVSGVNFQLKRSAANPMEYLYTLQMKAWRRVTLDKGAGVLDSGHQFVARQPNLYSTLLSRMSAAVDALQKTGDLVKSIIQDPLNRLAEVNREVTLFIKTAVGIQSSLNDLPKNFQRDVSVQILSDKRQWANLVSQNPELTNTPPSVFLDGINKHLGTKQQPLVTSLTNNQYNPSNILTDDQLTKIFNTIRPEQLSLPSVLLNTLNAEKARVNAFTRLDFETRRDEIRVFADNFADAVGAGSLLYNSIYNRPAPTVSREPTDDEWNILFALNEIITVLDHLAASGTINPIQTNSLEYVAGLAEQAGIAFKVPQSKYAVPFPYGFTLERLAAQYLGDPNRWHEIATLNGLREPYVDEEGFDLPFLVNGSNNVLYVSDLSNLFLNQTVYISSNTKLRSKRHILSIKEIYSGFVEVVVDGANDLSSFTTADSAILEAFLPGTVNSQQVIYIPSEKAADVDPKLKDVPGVDIHDPLLQVSGIDLLLTQDGDLIITPDGDTRLAYGLQNIIQTVKLAFTTPKGSILHHPEYGLAIEPGMSTADVNAMDIAKSAVNMFNGDDLFEEVKSVQVNKQGNTISITLVLAIKGVGSNVPISFNISN